MEKYTLRCLILSLFACISISGCGGGSEQVSNDSGSTPITEPKPEPKPDQGKNEAEHTVKRSKLGGGRVQKTTSGAHDLSASVSIITKKASSENFSLTNAAAN
ncbi:hypothetical protein [Pseudoalteromonas umbrosa]|uniref:hypothetical protein n=1 Tax=Pseudoalteromonas umbrosa TaxID=3048489 RepID=UPI0024C38088|nr:hypothetical protein [Pseudoalteromonas sp. B95]MDK1287569.1 hypothetical protein [Pseudoalteromonas sp. B95]